MKQNNLKTRMTKLEEERKRLEEKIDGNSDGIAKLREKFNEFVENHFSTFQKKVTETLVGLEVQTKNNTKLTWFLLTAVIGLYALIISLLMRK